jgi:two-component system, NtrC family, response regulator AtoC
MEMLAWRFIDEFKQAGYRDIRAMETQARDALVAHSWPGNVRELRNVIEYASAIGDGDVLRVHDLPPELRGEKPPLATSQTLGDLERQRILEALNKTHGRRDEAAAQLGMARSTLWRKIREYGIVLPKTARDNRGHD